MLNAGPREQKNLKHTTALNAALLREQLHFEILLKICKNLLKIVKNCYRRRTGPRGVLRNSTCAHGFKMSKIPSTWFMDTP